MLAESPPGKLLELKGQARPGTLSPPEYGVYGDLIAYQNLLKGDSRFRNCKSRGTLGLRVSSGVG